MNEFPSDGVPSMSQADKRRLRRERRRKHTMPKIRTRARTPETEPSAMVRFLLRMALESPGDGRADLEAVGAVNDEDAL